jgi:hypothetical protein
MLFVLVAENGLKPIFSWVAKPKGSAIMKMTSERRHCKKQSEARSRDSSLEFSVLPRASELLSGYIYIWLRSASTCCRCLPLGRRSSMNAHALNAVELKGNAFRERHSIATRVWKEEILVHPSVFNDAYIHTYELTCEGTSSLRGRSGHSPCRWKKNSSCHCT